MIKKNQIQKNDKSETFVSPQLSIKKPRFVFLFCGETNFPFIVSLLGALTIGTQQHRRRSKQTK